ncbi:MAG: hypothetical protein ACOYXC_16245, partial [Candidatus Rifleibacteriota bacterium]
MKKVKKFESLVLIMVLSIFSLYPAFCRDLIKEAEAILQQRPDVVDSIGKSFGMLETPFDILDKWLQFTDENSESVQRSRSILETLTPEYILSLRPDIRQSVRESTGATDPVEILRAWLKWNTTEKSGFVTMARYAVGKNQTKETSEKAEDLADLNWSEVIEMDGELFWPNGARGRNLPPHAVVTDALEKLT